MEVGQMQAEVLRLLKESPLTSEQVLRDVRELVSVGEVLLAFDLIVSWLYEDSLPISPQFYDELMAMAGELEMNGWDVRLRELVRER
jgi:hypothetical protein